MFAQIHEDVETVLKLEIADVSGCYVCDLTQTTVRNPNIAVVCKVCSIQVFYLLL